MTTDPIPMEQLANDPNVGDDFQFRVSVGEVRKALQALADVGTLDEWALLEKGRWWDIDSDAPGLACVLHDLTPTGDWQFDAESFQDARAKAAAWVRGLK